MPSIAARSVCRPCGRRAHLAPPTKPLPLLVVKLHVEGGQLLLGSLAAALRLLMPGAPVVLGPGRGAGSLQPLERRPKVGAGLARPRDPFDVSIAGREQMEGEVAPVDRIERLGEAGI